MQTAREIADAVRSGSTTAAAVFEATLKRIDAHEADLEAFVELDRAGPSKTPQSALSGPLAGVPVAIKDIIDVGGITTRVGADEFFHRHPTADATAVARLKAGGATIVGKSHTTQFAYLDTAPTRNPWHPSHTPGGSSSGSAAAVGAGLVPLALGSQTVGSVLRPAAFCACVGLKPSFGRIPYSGTAYFAPSFDHLGIICRSVADAALALSVIAGYDSSDPRAVDRPVDDYIEAVRSPRPPRIAFARRFTNLEASLEVARHLDDVAGRLAAAGATVTDIEMPLTPREISEAGQPVLKGEAAAVHFDAFRKNPEGYRPHIAALVSAGMDVTAVDLLRAYDQLAALRLALTSLLDGFDAILMPSAPTTAPTRETTGNGIYCAPATFTGLPSIALPSGVGQGGLPLSVQLVSAPFAETTLLNASAWVEGVLDFKATPPGFDA